MITLYYLYWRGYRAFNGIPRMSIDSPAHCLLQAEANIVLGSTQEGFLCPPGQFENRTAWAKTGSLL
jgi:hypothetical protein